MYSRFPELVPPAVYGRPKPEEIASGEWCYPHFTPDESNVTMLDPHEPTEEQFSSLKPEYLWLRNDRQTVVAVSSPHPHDPNHDFYRDINDLYGYFIVGTAGRERITLREGRLWPAEALAGSDEEIITKGGEALYLQALAYRSGVECWSTEPEKEKDILAVMHRRPELRPAAVMYLIMRMLPQTYRFREHQSPRYRVEGLHYLKRFLAERRTYHGGSWAGHHLYTTNLLSGPGGLNAIGRHLANAHGLRHRGYAFQGWDLAGDPPEEVRDQIFRCTNSPVFHAGDVEYKDLCDVQRVAVLVNRLRDRRIAYLLADLGRRAVSYFWVSGPLHYEVMVPSLRAMATERGLSTRDVRAEFGAVAIRTVVR